MAGSPQQVATDHAKAVFLKELAKTGNVSAAARAGGQNRATFYWHREKDDDFADAWDDAIEQATDRLELEARRRAHDGVEEPVFYQGVEVGTVRRYSDTLMIQLLKAHHPAHRETIRHKHTHAGQDGGAIAFTWRAPASPNDSEEERDADDSVQGEGQGETRAAEEQPDAAQGPGRGEA